MVSFVFELRFKFAQVHLVGPGGEMDRLRRLTRQSSSMQVNTRRVWNYLRVRQALYPDDAATRALPSLEELDTRLAGLQDALLRDARVMDDAHSRAVARAAEDDVAGVRLHTEEHATEHTTVRCSASKLCAVHRSCVRTNQLS